MSYIDYAKYENMGLKQEQVKKCKEAFDAFDLDNSHFIEINEQKFALEEMGHKPSEEELYKMMNEVDIEGKNEMSFDDFVKIIVKQKNIKEEKEEQDILDAFVAQGGNYDKSGELDVDQVKKIILEEFQMTIDLNKLQMEIDSDGNNTIDYNEFKDQLSN